MKTENEKVNGYSCGPTTSADAHGTAIGSDPQLAKCLLKSDDESETQHQQPSPPVKLRTEFLPELAQVVEKIDDAAEWKAAHAKGLVDFHRRFFDGDAGGYSPTLRSGNQPAERAGN